MSKKDKPIITKEQINWLENTIHQVLQEIKEIKRCLYEA